MRLNRRSTICTKKSMIIQSHYCFSGFSFGVTFSSRCSERSTGGFLLHRLLQIGALAADAGPLSGFRNLRLVKFFIRVFGSVKSYENLVKLVRFCRFRNGTLNPRYMFEWLSPKEWLKPMVSWDSEPLKKQQRTTAKTWPLHFGKKVKK